MKFDIIKTRVKAGEYRLTTTWTTVSPYHPNKTIINHPWDGILFVGYAHTEVSIMLQWLNDNFGPDSYKFEFGRLEIFEEKVKVAFLLRWQ